MLVAIEGGDKCGKSTIAQMFKKQYGCESIKFPNRESLTGRVLDGFLSGSWKIDLELVHELFSANRHECINFLKECSDSDDIFFLDRYFYSGAAYSICSGLEIEWCLSFDSDLPKPALVLWLNPPLNLVSARLAVCTDIELYESVGFQKMLDTAFRNVFAYTGARVCEITCDGPVDEVFAECLFQLQSRFDLTTE